jgi:hypothetical protein
MSLEAALPSARVLAPWRLKRYLVVAHDSPSRDRSGATLTYRLRL